MLRLVASLGSGVTPTPRKAVRLVLGGKGARCNATRGFGLRMIVGRTRGPPVPLFEVDVAYVRRTNVPLKIPALGRCDRGTERERRRRNRGSQPTLRGTLGAPKKRCHGRYDRGATI